MTSAPLARVQLCYDRSDALEFYKVAGLYLKPIAKLSITVTLPKLKSGQSISNSEIDQKLHLAIKPVTFSYIKVTKSTMDFLRFEAEIATRVALEGVVQKIDCKGIKIDGFPALKIRATEGKVSFPTRMQWDDFFEDNKQMNLRKAGERPDTVVLKNLPKRWFGYPSLPDRPSELLIEKIVCQFGKVRNIDIPTNDAMRFKMSEAISGLTPEMLDTQNLLFNVFVQFEDYIGFDKCMNALRGNKLLLVRDEKAWTCVIDVDFDKTKHLSDESIKRRKEDRDRLLVNDAKDRDRLFKEREERRVQDEKEQLRAREKETRVLAALHEKREVTMREREERRRKREQERREKKLRQSGANGVDELMDERIANEERKLRIAQRRVESIRLLDELLRRIRLGDSTGNDKKDGADWEDPERGRIVSSMIQNEEDAIGHHKRQVNMAHMGQSRLSSIIAQSDPLENISSRSISNSPPATMVSAQSSVSQPPAVVPGPVMTSMQASIRPVMAQQGYPPNWNPNMRQMPQNMRPPMHQPPMNYQQNFQGMRPIMHHGGPPMQSNNFGGLVPPYQQANFYNNVGGGYGGMGRGGFYQGNMMRGQFPGRRPYQHYGNVPRDPNAILAGKPDSKKSRRSRNHSRSRSRSRSRNWSWSSGSHSRSSRSRSRSSSRSGSDQKRHDREYRSKSANSKKGDKEKESSKRVEGKGRSRSKSGTRHSASPTKSRNGRRSRSASSSSRSRSCKRSSRSHSSSVSRRRRSKSSRSRSSSNGSQKTKKTSSKRRGKNDVKSPKDNKSVSPNIRESDLELSTDPDEEKLTRHNQFLLNGQQQFTGPPNQFWNGAGPGFDGGFSGNRGGGRFHGARGRPYPSRMRGGGRGAPMWNPGFEEIEGDPMDGFIDGPQQLMSPTLRRKGEEFRGDRLIERRARRSMERREHDIRHSSPGIERYHPSRGRGRARMYEEDDFAPRRPIRAGSRSAERFEEFGRGRSGRPRGRGFRAHSRESSFDEEYSRNYRKPSLGRDEYPHPRSVYEDGRQSMRGMNDPRGELSRKVRKPGMEEEMSGRLYSDRMDKSVHQRVSRPGRDRSAGRVYEGDHSKDRSRYSIEREHSTHRPNLVSLARNGGSSNRRSREGDRKIRPSRSQTPPEVRSRRKQRKSESPKESMRPRDSRKHESRSPRIHRESVSPQDKRHRRSASRPETSRKNKESESPANRNKRKTTVRAGSSSRERSKKSRKLDVSSHSREDKKKKSTRGPVLRDKRQTAGESDDSPIKSDKFDRAATRVSVESSKSRVKSLDKRDKTSLLRRRSPVKRSLSHSSLSHSRSRSVEVVQKSLSSKRTRTVNISAMYDEQENDSNASTPSVLNSGLESDSATDDEELTPKRKKHKKHSKKGKKDKKSKKKKSKKSRK